MAELTSRERWLRAWRKEVPDRAPIHVRGVHVLSEDWRRSAHPSYAPLIAEVDQHCDKVLNWSPNLGFYLTRPELAPCRIESRPAGEDRRDEVRTVTTPDGPLVSVTRHSMDGIPGMIMKHFISDEEDYERFLSIPYEQVPQDAEPFFVADRRVGQKGIVLVTLSYNPLGMVFDLLGSETLAIWSLMHRDRIRVLLSELARRHQDLAKTLLKAGVGPFFGTLGHEACLPPLQSPTDFDEFIVKVDKLSMDCIHDAGSMVHIHCHSRLKAVLDGFVELGTDILHPFEAPPMGDITLKEAKERVRGRICIEGNLQIGDLMRCTPEEIRQMTRQIVRDAGDGGGLVLCPTASPYEPVLSQRTLENYLSFIRAGLEFGRY